jgi:hypothetical protein
MSQRAALLARLRRDAVVAGLIVMIGHPLQQPPQVARPPS